MRLQERTRVIGLILAKALEEVLVDTAARELPPRSNQSFLQGMIIISEKQTEGLGFAI